MGERVRKPRGTRALVLVAVVLAATLTVVPGPAAARPSQPAAVTAQMTPNVDLVDNMEVTVTGHGFVPGRVVGVAMCLGATPPVDVDFCQARSAMLAAVDPNGDVTVPMVLDMVLYLPWLGGWRPFDCRDFPCAIWVVDLTDPSQAAPVPLPYAPDSPNLPGELTLTPAGEIVDAQQVTVAGRLFPGGGNVGVRQCATDPPGSSPCSSRRGRPVPIRPDGTFSLPFRVDAVLPLGRGETVDCRTEACEIRVDDAFDDVTEPDAVVPLDLDPDAPLAGPFPTTVTPTTDLVDGQQVTITASGYDARESVTITQCATADPAEERCDQVGGGSADAQGRVSRTLPVAVGIGPITEPFDCRTGSAPGGTPCVLRVGPTTDLYDSHRTAVVDLHFDPEGPGPPPPPAPTVTVQPATGIGDNELLAVEVTSVPLFQPLDIALCSADGLHCDLARTTALNVTTHHALFNVMGVFEATDGEVVDCRAAPGCRIVARTATFTAQSEVLGFAPQEPQRYLDPIVADVEVTPDLVYRHTTDPDGDPIDLALDLYEPAGDTTTDRPVVVLVPGGWFRSVDRAAEVEARVARNFARRGYVVAVMDYRTLGGPGTGFPDFATSVMAAVAAYDDVTAGIGWLAERAGELGIDPDRVVAAGRDAGGITAFNLAHVPGQRGPATSLVAAAVPLSGLSLGVPEPGEPPVLAYHSVDDPDIDVAAVQRNCDNAVAVGLVCRLRVLGVGSVPLPTLEHMILHETTRFLEEQGVVNPGTG